jgi:hypothetical protein
MAKQNGLGYSIVIDNSAGVAKTISNDITNFQFATPRGVQDVTGVDKSAMERILLLADFSITLNLVFNTTTDMSHDIFKDVTSTSVGRTTVLTVSAKAMTAEVLYTDYPISRSNSGELTAAVPGVLQNGVAPAWS